MTRYANFICGGTLVPASRFRVHPVEAALRGEGWSTTLLQGYGPTDAAIRDRNLRFVYRGCARIVRAARTASLCAPGPVMVQRLSVPWNAASELFLSKRRPLIFDFDDAVFLNSHGQSDHRRNRAFREICKRADRVVAGNSWLAQQAGSGVEATIIPTCIDTSVYGPGCPLAERADKTPVLGWIGTSSNFPQLTHLQEPLSALRAAGYRFDFRLCSDIRDDSLLKSLGARFTRWTPEGELNFLQSLDIGLMPLSNDDWSRGKCSFKMIQYMAVGCPVVASAVGMNCDVLEGEIGGYLVEENAWFAPLAKLLTSTETRAKLGSEARKRAVDRYDISVAISAYRKIFLDLQ